MDIKKHKYFFQVVLMLFVFVVFTFIFFYYRNGFNPINTNQEKKVSADSVHINIRESVSDKYTIINQHYYVPEFKTATSDEIEKQIGMVKRIGNNLENWNGIYFVPGTKLYKLKGIPVEKKVAAEVHAEKEGDIQFQVLINVGAVNEVNIKSLVK